MYRPAQPPACARLINHFMHIPCMKKVILMLLFQVALLGVGAQEPSCVYPPAPGSENVAILRVQYAANTLNEEYIVLFNTGKTTQDLSEWVLFNAAYDSYRKLPLIERTDPSAWKNVYKIPSGVTLGPSCWVRICSGRGKNTSLYLYRNLTTQWLGDQSDTLFLYDNTCNLICTYSWP